VAQNFFSKWISFFLTNAQTNAFHKNQRRKIMSKQELTYAMRQMIKVDNDTLKWCARLNNTNDLIELARNGKHRALPPEYKFITPRRIFFFIIYIIISGGIGLLIGLIMKGLFVDVFHNTVLHIISIVIESIGWLLITYSNYSSKYKEEKKQYEATVKSINKYNANLEAAQKNLGKNLILKKKISSIIEENNRQYSMWREKAGRLHENYCNRRALTSLISILEEGRADTLKEAINQYINDERARERAEAEDEYRAKQNELQRQILAEQQYQSEMAAQSAEANARAAARLKEINDRESWREFERDIGIR
ncbi:MAG: hypothetical protein ACI4TH_05635, partial [Candidatus Ornithomonoglobus sp.]